MIRTAGHPRVMAWHGAIGRDPPGDLRSEEIIMSHATSTVTPPTSPVDGTWSITTSVTSPSGITESITRRLMAMSDGCACDAFPVGADCVDCDEYAIGAEIGGTIALSAIDLESRVINVEIDTESITIGGAIADVLWTSGAGHRDITITGRGWSL